MASRSTVADYLAVAPDARRPLLAPSLLAADAADQGAAAAACEQGGADWLHFDVMDGSFVPLITFGQQSVAAVARRTGLPLDVHLMVDAPERHVDSFIAAGAAVVTVHLEATVHLHRVLRAIRAGGAAAGVAVVPSTPAAALDAVLGDVDLVLVMTVDPGYGGQPLIRSCLDKVASLAATRARLGASFTIEVDGGIDASTAASAVAAGAEVLVAGTAVFAGPPAEGIRSLRAAVR